MPTIGSACPVSSWRSRPTTTPAPRSPVPPDSVAPTSPRSWWTPRGAASPCTPGCTRSSSDADGPVDALAQQVGMAVVPGVLVDQVQHHQAERHVLAPPCLMADDVERGGLPLDLPGLLDLGLPRGEGLRPGGGARVVGHLVVALVGP